MSNSFFVFLESNTTDYPDNQPNKFRVHLPKPLYFSGNWVCGVHSISYPFSWPSTIGTLDEQWMKIHFIDDNLKKNVLQVPVPAASHNSVEALKNYLTTTLKHQSDAIGSVEKPGAFIPPPSLISSPPRAERIKRSEDEPISPPLKTPPLYEEEENKEKSHSPELITPPLYLEDENKDKTPSPTREEIRTPPLYLEEKEKERSPIPSTKEDAETLPPKPKKERKEEQEPKAKESVPQKPSSTDSSTIKSDKKEEKVHHEEPVTQKPPVLSNIGVSKEENKKEQEKPSTQKPSSNLLSTIGIAKKEEKKEQDKPHSQPRPSSALSSIGLNKKEEKKVQDKSTIQKPPSSVLSSIGLDTKDKKEQENPPSVLTSVGLGRKEEEKQKTKPPAPAPREVLKSPPRYKEDNKTPSLKPEKEQIITTQKPSDSNIPSSVDLSRKDEKKPKENSTQKSSVSTNAGLENNKKQEKKSQKRPASVLDSIGLGSSRKEEKKDEQKVQKTPSTVLSALGLAKKKDNMTQTTPPSSPTVLGAMGLKSSRKEQYNPRADKLFEVLFGKDYKLKETTPNLTLLKNIIDSIELHYLKDFSRFKAVFKNESILSISFSPQLGYVLGFSNPNNVYKDEIAKYGCDLRGGFSSFAIYAKGLTENMIVGNSLSSLLRVVSISGAVPGEYNEKIYDSPIYARVLPREINEIEVELRTMDNGRLVPFAFGTVHIVLIFKKVINF
uniref:Uncharacterized protein n=2 Tax=Meloidogyne enterolobii TaxID=390850 RepID=A0A6V7XXK4_MELEN|nr:unnamed protein product [Meloidogyne enterolobii]